MRASARIRISSSLRMIGMLLVALVLMVVGAFWLKKTVDVEV